MKVALVVVVRIRLTSNMLFIVLFVDHLSIAIGKAQFVNM